MGRLTQIDGVPVQDGTKPITLNVKNIDISRANTKEPDACAVARACYRELKAKEVRVHLSRVYVRLNGSFLRYCTPAALRSEIIAFDRGGEFEPGQYALSVPPPSRTLTGKRRGGIKTHRVATGARRKKAHTVSNVRVQAHS